MSEIVNTIQSLKNVSLALQRGIIGKNLSDTVRDMLIFEADFTAMTLPLPDDGNNNLELLERAERIIENSKNL